MRQRRNQRRKTKVPEEYTKAFGDDATKLDDIDVSKIVDEYTGGMVTKKMVNFYLRMGAVEQ